MFVEIKNLSVSFQKTKVLQCESLEIRKGEIFALVGESGCGKTTFGKTLAGLLIPDKGSDIRISCPQTKVQMVFQDPYSSLNPKMRVEQIVSEGLIIQTTLSKNERRTRCLELLEQVGLDSSYLARYPKELSGGQRQRIGIARALAVEPEFLILDEPVSALDPELQYEILLLLKKLQTERGLTYFLISHDLPLVKQFADRIGVMYLGKIVEIGNLKSPSHPYTDALLAAVPVPDPKTERALPPFVLQGELPSPASPPPGCPFHPRCPKAKALCRERLPELLPLNKDQLVRCHFPRN